MGGVLLSCVTPSGQDSGGKSATAGPLLAPAESGAPAVLVLVTISGLTPDLHTLGGPMPTLAALAEAGVAAERVESVVPASSYPVHASLVTGVEPAAHGVLGDRRIGPVGLLRERPFDAALLLRPPLWQVLQESGVAVASLDWPTTQGAAVTALLPDGEPLSRSETWLDVLAPTATPWLLGRAREAPVAAHRAGPARDRLLVDAGCHMLGQPAAPRLLLMRLRGSELSLRGSGVGTVATRAAFAALDGELRRLVDCIGEGPHARRSALVVAGDRAYRPVHSALRPNRVLADAGLIGPDDEPWQALARSAGGSAFVYARGADEALVARAALDEEAATTRAFRVVSAQEMIAQAADPEAWFGLEAAPGFVFLDGQRGPRVAAAAQRSAAGYLEDHGPGPAFVAWGRGFRRGLVVPSLHQLDVAPTLGRLLAAELPGAQGRGLIGLLRVPAGTAAPARQAAP